MEVTLVHNGTEEALDVVATPDGRLLAPASDLTGLVLLGWERKPQGWCRGDACVPARRAREAETADGVDLHRFADLVGSVLAVDLPEKAIAAGEGVGTSAAALTSGTAPDFTLADTAGRPHSLSHFRGRKVALVLWASWCGCRYDLPAWEAQHVALAGYGFTVVSVALDRDPSDAVPWIDEARPTHPALIDADGVVADRYNVVNVPTVVWVDEDGRMVRPPDTQVATDLFRSMNGLSSARVLAALRRWVLDGDPGLSGAEVAQHLRLPTHQEQHARAEARLGVWLLRRDRRESAERHLALAAQLAPHDLTIRRGTMPLRGVDPMGEEYFALREELTRAGVALYRPLPDWHAATPAEEVAG